MLIKLYSNPSELLKPSTTDRQLWPRAWLTSAFVLIAALVILDTAASLSGQPVVVMLCYAALSIVSLMVVISVVTTVTHHAQLWLLYLCAPPSVLTALLWGVGLLWPGAWMISGILGTPALIGILISCACAVYVSNQTSHLAREQTRVRQTEQPVHLAILDFHNCARTTRLVTAAGAGALACAVQLLFWAAAAIDGAIIGLALIVGAGACLRIEASLYCWLGSPLVTCDNQGVWRTTYAGRWALFVPASALMSLLTREQFVMQTGSALITLLHTGGLGPVLRQAFARLTSAQATQAALGLSLQPGGAYAIRYLAPAISPDVRNTILTYACLAEEAARPHDMQRWLAALDEYVHARQLAQSDHMSELDEALIVSRKALRCHTYNPMLEEATQRLRQVILVIYGAAVEESTAQIGWPIALLHRIIAQTQFLR